MGYETDDGAQVLDDLSAAEQRVLGCLIEKESTTPDAYPLTLNSLRLACNQSTSRDPVVVYSDFEVEQALATLRQRGITRTVHSTSNRAAKFKHVAGDAFGLSKPELALVCVLMLRGAQTVGELKTRTERQFTFRSTDDVEATLTALAARDRPLVVQLARQPGQKDARWIHLLGDVTTAPVQPAPSSGPVQSADPYGEATAEFYDLLATGMWETFGLELIDLLADVDPTLGPLVDIGCGSGTGLAYLSAAVPGVSVHAIEPSKAMRTALHARLSLDPQLRQITTVVPFPFATAPLPATASAVVVSAALGHFTPAERERLWTYLANQLAPGAPAVIGVLPPFRAESVPLVNYHTEQVGEFAYEGWQSGEPVDDRTMRWTLLYRVVDRAGATVVEHRVVADWNCDGPDDVAAEIFPYGLAMTDHDGCVVVRRGPTNI
ncbi:MAG TPA: DUF480 domain-containing protein [Ilumatobacter sp.]|nr:DUF480 domain-containing protein [Ilumatobacter sp.]